jgi:hypothetical protein
MPFFRDNLHVFASYSLFLKPFKKDVRFPLHIAIFEQDIATVKRWIACRGDEWMTCDAFSLAARLGNRPMIEYFCQTKYIPTDRVAWEKMIKVAEDNGQVDIAAFLRHRKKEIKRDSRLQLSECNC